MRQASTSSAKTYQMNGSGNRFTRLQACSSASSNRSCMAPNRSPFAHSSRYNLYRRRRIINLYPRWRIRLRWETPLRVLSTILWMRISRGSLPRHSRGCSPSVAVRLANVRYSFPDLSWLTIFFLWLALLANHTLQRCQQMPNSMAASQASKCE